MTTSDRRPQHPVATGVSWLLLGLTLLAVAGAAMLQAIGCGALFDPSHPEPALAYGFLMLPLNGLAFALLGTRLTTYRPENRFGWLASLYGLSMMWVLTTSAYGECNFESRAALVGGDYAVWLGYTLQAPAFMSLAFLPWLFPDGRFLTARWRRVGLAGVALVLVLGGLRAIWPIPVRVDSFGRYWIENPMALNVPTAPWLAAILTRGGDNVITLLFLGGIVSLVLRWRRSTGETRQQLKWLAYHFAIAGTLFMAVEVIGAAAYPAIFNGWFYLLVLLLFWLGLPVVMGLAVFKYRLYDIDIVIRKTLIYATLSGLLALVYFGGVILLQRLFGALTGVAQSPLAVVLSTLVIAALFTPLRRRIQDFIDHRFYRRKYDARQVLARFAQAARDETDIDALTAELTGVVQETLQPERVSVWLSEHKIRPGAGAPEPASTYRKTGG
jgi:hypothetical protein